MDEPTGCCGCLVLLFFIPIIYVLLTEMPLLTIGIIAAILFFTNGQKLIPFVFGTLLRAKDFPRSAAEDTPGSTAASTSIAVLGAAIARSNTFTFIKKMYSFPFTQLENFCRDFYIKHYSPGASDLHLRFCMLVIILTVGWLAFVLHLVILCFSLGTLALAITDNKNILDFIAILALLRFFYALRLVIMPDNLLFKHS